MATSQSPVSRQPTKLDYASPTQFRFGIHQLPKVEFFGTAVNLPGITLGVIQQPTPFKNIPITGDKLEYENLTLTFIVDEYLENYISLHNWMTGIGFPSQRSQFSTHRDETSNTPTDPLGSTTDIGITNPPSPDRAMYSDANLMILSNKNNPIVEVDFQNIFPVSLGALEYNQDATDVEYISTTAEFAYQIYEFKPL
tara:strand:- start:3571 stop:4161 length:591 start_codon:yes stop_codon:yes gene_type:complete